MAGVFGGQITLADNVMLTATASSRDIFVIKRGSDGAHAWGVQLGTEGKNTPAVFVAEDNKGNTIVFGTFAGSIVFPDGAGGVKAAEGTADLFLAKIDQAGAISWGTTFGAPGFEQKATGLAVDSSGNIFIAGDLSGDLDFDQNTALSSAGDTDIFIAKLDPSGGAVLWAKSFGGQGFQGGARLASDAAGNVLVAGKFSGVLSFDDKGTLVGTGTSPSGTFDAFAAKLSPSGEHLWSKGFGGPGDEISEGVAASTAGEVAVTGSFNYTISIKPGEEVSSSGSEDVFVVKLKP
jgi:hypothetical protein